MTCRPCMQDGDVTTGAPTFNLTGVVIHIKAFTRFESCLISYNIL